MIFFVPLSLFIFILLQLLLLLFSFVTDFCWCRWSGGVESAAVVVAVVAVAAPSAAVASSSVLSHPGTEKSTNSALQEGHTRTRLK